MTDNNIHQKEKIIPKIFNKDEEFITSYEVGLTPYEYEALWRGRFYKMLHLLIKVFLIPVLCIWSFLHFQELLNKFL